MHNFSTQPIDDSTLVRLTNISSTHLDSITCTGYDILSAVIEKNNMIDQNVINHNGAILLLFRELLETLDGLKSLLEGHSFNSLDMHVRNIFELTLSIDYVFSDKQLIEKRALSYIVDSIYNKIQLFDRVKDADDQANINSAEVDNAISMLKEQLKNYPDIVKDRNSKISWAKNNRFKNTIPKWYGIHSKAHSISSLCNLLNKKDLYISYQKWSNKLHGGAAMSGMITLNNEVLLLNPKLPRKTIEISTAITYALKLSFICYNHLATYYLSPSHIIDVEIWYHNASKVNDDICRYWETLAFKSQV